MDSGGRLPSDELKSIKKSLGLKYCQTILRRLNYQLVLPPSGSAGVPVANLQICTRDANCNKLLGASNYSNNPDLPKPHLQNGTSGKSGNSASTGADVNADFVCGL